MEKVRPWCGQSSYRGRLKNRTEQTLNLTIPPRTRSKSNSQDRDWDRDGILVEPKAEAQSEACRDRTCGLDVEVGTEFPASRSGPTVPSRAEDRNRDRDHSRRSQDSGHYQYVYLVKCETLEKKVSTVDEIASDECMFVPKNHNAIYVKGLR